MKRRRHSTRSAPEQSGRPRPSRARLVAGMALIELLVVVALILILTVLYWTSSAPSREQRQRAACRQNLQGIYMALKLYADQQAEKFPAVPGARTAEEALDVLVPHYTVDTSVFTCPSSKDRPLPAGESLRKHKISYAYYMGRKEADAAEVLMSDEQVSALPKAAGLPLFSATGRAPGNNHGQHGGNLLFGDGHADWCAPRAPGGLVFTQGVVLLNP